MEGKSHKQNSIPVTVVAGFLGAGKTTLLNHILNGEHGLKIAVVVNDFGSINIDAELVSDVNEGMVSLANGCICCVIRSDLISAVLKLVNQHERLDHIVIESSGVAYPASVVKAFLDPGIWKDVFIDGVITVVDAEQTLNLPAEELKLAEKQIKEGDLIILNKIDLLNKKDLRKVNEQIAEIRPGVEILETSQCKVPIEILLGIQASYGAETLTPVPMNSHYRDTEHNHSHHHDLQFETWTYESDEPLILELFRYVLQFMPKTLYRAKGFLYTVEKEYRQYILQLTGRRATIAVGGHWKDGIAKTQLVFIAKKDTVNFMALEKALNDCKAFAESEHKCC